MIKSKTTRNFAGNYTHTIGDVSWEIQRVNNAEWGYPGGIHWNVGINPGGMVGEWHDSYNTLGEAKIACNGWYALHHGDNE